MIDIDESSQNSVFTVPSVGHAPAQSVDVNIASEQSRGKTYIQVKSGVTGVTSEKVIIIDAHNHLLELGPRKSRD